MAASGATGTAQDVPNIGVGQTAIPGANTGATSFPLDPTSPLAAVSSNGTGVEDLGGGYTGTGSTAVGGDNSVLSQFLSSLTGGVGLGTALGTALPYVGIGEAAQSAANAQEQNVANTVKPLVTTGQSLITAGQQPLSEYQSGSVTPSEDAILKQNAASQKSQVAQMLGAQGVVDSSALVSADQQIDNNSLAQRQQYVEQNLQDALSLDEAGLAPLTTAITDTLNSDTAIQNTLTQLWGTLASAYAKQLAGSAGGGGAGGGSNPLGSAANSAENNAVKSALNNVNSGNVGAGDPNSGLNLSNVPSITPNLGDTGASAWGSDAFGSAVDSAYDTGSAAIDAASGAATDVGFTSASAAAGAGEGLAAAGDAGLDLGAAGAGITDAGIQSGIDAGIAEGAGAAGLGTAAALTAGVGAAGVGIYELVNSLTKANNPDVINTSKATAEGMQVNPYGKLPSGNSVLFDQSLGVGAGTQSSEGSGEIYQLNQNKAQDAANAANPGSNQAYHWIGQENSTNLENDAHNLAEWLASGAITVNNGEYTATNAAGQRTLGGINSIYDTTGGEAGWGIDESQFVTDLHNELSSGVYTSGDAFGRGN